MRIDASQVLGQGGVKIKSGIGSAADSLKEGDVVRAKVVSGDRNGAVTLKMENGQSFGAKLGTDIKLTAGDTILLEVTGKEKGQISLTFSGVETKDEEFSASQTNLVRDFSDKSLAPYASKLAELKMPVTEEAARLMRDLIAQDPNLTLDKAAFLATNKLSADPNLLRAAIEALSGGDKTDAMLAKLLESLASQDSQMDRDIGVSNTEPGTKGPALAGTASGESAPAFTVSTTNSSPLTELLTLIVKNASGLLQAQTQGETSLAADTQPIITQPGGNMQINDETTTNFTHLSQPSQEQGLNNPLQGDVQQTGIQTPQGGVPGETQSVLNVPEGAPLSGESVATTNGNSSGAAGTPSTGTPPSPSTGSVVAQLLSEIPEFKGTPFSALERFSEMLLKVASDVRDALINPETAKDTELLAAQIDKLFTRIGKNDADTGARLREAREELFARLALIEEAISRAAGPARAEMLQHTQKLMDHVRLLNSIDQFVYMQLPVQLREERKSAELYIFKRKGGKRSDPDNVNILLAIDLVNMGHWEALLNIKNKDVSLNMEVAGEAEKEHFSENTVMLHELLKEEGFKLVSTSIKLCEKETTPITALSAFDRYTGGRRGAIDFMI